MRGALAAVVLSSIAACGGSEGEAAAGDSGAGGSAGGGATAGASGDAGATSGGTAGASAAAGGGAGTGGATGGEGGSSGAGGSAGAAPSCPPASIGAGSTADVPIEFGGAQRRYLLHVPAGWDGVRPLPLVLNFHGYTYSADQQPDYTGASSVADANGFAVAYPDGVGKSWNGGACCGTAASSNLDDVGFARAVVADASAKVCVDARRVYATGMSNGGFLSHRLACEAADLFAAVAPVAGVLGIDPGGCAPSRPIPVMHFHGTSDLVVPYGGNPLLRYPSVATTIDGWTSRNACTDAPTTTFSNGSARCDSRLACSGGVEVTLCTIEGMGHCWPGRSSCLFSASTDISASEAMWGFFQKHRLP